MTTEHPHFPIGLTTHWQNPGMINLSAEFSKWLLDPGSLTARLKENRQDFQVRLLGQQVVPCAADEATEGIPANTQVLAREVLLYCDGSPYVFARSLLPLATLAGEQQKLAQLGEQPLGQVLFNDPSLQREKFEVGRFAADSGVYALARSLYQQSMPDELLGRRSQFFIDGKPLMVAEVFLPDAQLYET
jgi:chorismate--pyruvate lyase